MSTSVTSPARVAEIGHDIFDLADEARPGFLRKPWWMDQMTRWVDLDPVLRSRVFQFVDCLPSLWTPAAIAEHFSEYLNPDDVRFPRVLHALAAGGPCARIRAEILSRFVRFGASQMAGRFIAGFDESSLFCTLERLRREGMAFTLDVLGESTTSYAQAERYAAANLQLIEKLPPRTASWPVNPRIDHGGHGPMPRVNLSLKLTGLDPHCDAIDPDRAIREIGARLRPLLRRARAVGALVNLDMESTKHRAITLEVFQRVLFEDEFRDWTDVGIVVQAYLRTGESDLNTLLDWGRRRAHRFVIRLVKGAYWDSETAAAVRNHKTPPVWTEKWQSDANYERMVRVMLEHAEQIRPAFASHNVRSLACVLATGEHLGVSPGRYEVQMLHGMGDPLKTAMVQLGQCVRVYCPYGDLVQGMAYLIRRLLENTSNEGFLKQAFGDSSRRAAMLDDPVAVRHPKGQLPQRFSQDTDPENTMSRFVNASHTDFTSADARLRMKGAIEYVRGEFGKYVPMIVQGEPVASEESFASVNPSKPLEVVAHVASGTRADVDRAVAAACKAFPSWRSTTVSDRAALLQKVADRLELRRFELAALMILEVGKPWREADAEVSEAIDHCRFYADQIERIDSRPRLRHIPGEDNALTYSPKGVCAVLSPWPFPLSILTGMATAAVAVGNTVVIKPARHASGVASKLVEIIHEVGTPPGVVNLLLGSGDPLGRNLVEHEDVPVVAFTGSAEVGTQLLEIGARLRPRQRFIRKMIFELGGKNAIIVDEDADLDGAIAAVIESAFAFSGQKCSSCSRVIVVGGVYESFCRRLKEAALSMTIGAAESPSAFVGPVVDESARRRIREFIDAAAKECELLVEVPLTEGARDGFFVSPVVFLDVPRRSRLAQEEILGPVLSVMPARDFDEAIDVANDSRFALTGGVFSRDLAHIEQARREFAVGNLYINRRITGSQVDVQPFGGFRLSGTGVKAGSPDYLLHFMDARCITENTQRSGFVPSERRAAT